MPIAERTIAIRRPVEQVYRFLADGRTATQWRPTELDITDRTPDQRVAFRVAAGPAIAIGVLDLEPMGEATILSLVVGAEVPGWRRFVLNPLLQAALDAEVRALDRLQEILER